MNRYAIIISVEDYSHFTKTSFAHADSELLCRTLTEICDYPSQHTLLLKLSPETEKRPVEILSEIKNIVDGSGPGDTILFYFAGHGHYSEGRTFLILPGTIPGAYETTALPLDDISKELRQPERACFRIFDSCHSGLDVRGDEINPDAEAFMRAIMQIEQATNSLVSFAVQKTLAKLHEHVAKRLEWLEKELAL